MWIWEIFTGLGTGISIAYWTWLVVTRCWVWFMNGTASLLWETLLWPWDPTLDSSCLLCWLWRLRLLCSGLGLFLFESLVGGSYLFFKSMPYGLLSFSLGPERKKAKQQDLFDLCELIMNEKWVYYNKLYEYFNYSTLDSSTKVLINKLINCTYIEQLLSIIISIILLVNIALKMINDYRKKTNLGAY